MQLGIQSNSYFSWLQQLVPCTQSYFPLKVEFHSCRPCRYTSYTGHNSSEVQRRLKLPTCPTPAWSTSLQELAFIQREAATSLISKSKSMQLWLIMMVGHHSCFPGFSSFFHLQQHWPNPWEQFHCKKLQWRMKRREPCNISESAFSLVQTERFLFSAKSKQKSHSWALIKMGKKIVSFTLL